MKILCHLVSISIVCAIIGCSSKEPTLDEAIDALPDEWGPYTDKLEQFAKKHDYTIVSRKSSRSNYAMLDKVIAVTNVQERIRLVWKLYNHFRRTPEWYVEHTDGGFVKRYRQDFFGHCAWQLMSSTNRTPETILSGWEMEAETIRDLVKVMQLTGPSWQERMQKRHDVKEAAEFEEFRSQLKKHGGGPYSYLFEKWVPELTFARDIRHRYNNFFKYQFRGNESYLQLPESMRPAFIEQLKRDFFIYSDVTNAFMWKMFPPELKKAYDEVCEQMEAKKRQLSGGKDTEER